MTTYEGVSAVYGKIPPIRVIIKEDGKAIGVTAPFPTWADAEQWEREQKMADGILVPCSECDKLSVCVGGLCADCTPEKEWDQHNDPPILVNADYFEQKPMRTPEQIREFKRFTIMYAQRNEEHTAHLERLLAMQGIECQCTAQTASPQCLIHVRDNVPED